jgi:two-component system CheB/CheR fusion protein
MSRKKRAENEPAQGQNREVMEKSHDFAENIVKAIHEPLVVLDADLHVVLANPSFYKLFKIKPAEAVEKHIKEVGIGEWATSEVMQALDEILSTDKTFGELNVSSDFPDGKRVFSLNIRQLPSLDGTEILITAEDMTESKQLEEKQDIQRKDLEKKLETAEHLAVIGQTAGMVGHDIRNPLQAIISAVYLAKDDLASLPQSKIKKGLIESMKEIENQADYISKIVADLQDFSRPLKPYNEETKLNKLIEDLIITLNIDENIKVLSEVADNIKKVTVDPAYVKRILTNLIMNSEQAMPNGGKITITAYKENGNCLITGEGILDDIKPNIFQPLFTTKSKGQGFGLAVSKRLAKAMGGDLTFESEIGKGAKFTLKLPNC